MKPATKEKQKTCRWCHEGLSVEESENPRTDPYGDIICDECFNVNFEITCTLCENYFIEPTKPEDHKFVVGRSLAKETDLELGVYSVLEYPFHYGDIVFGFSGFFDHAIKLERAMDVREYKRIDCSYRHVEPVDGGICLECFEELTTPINQVNQDGYINMNSLEKLHRTISLRGVMSAK